MRLGDFTLVRVLSPLRYESGRPITIPSGSTNTEKELKWELCHFVAELCASHRELLAKGQGILLPLLLPDQRSLLPRLKPLTS